MPVTIQVYRLQYVFEQCVGVLEGYGMSIRAGDKGVDYTVIKLVKPLLQSIEIERALFLSPKLLPKPSTPGLPRSFVFIVHNAQPA